MNRERAFFVLGWTDVMQGDAYEEWREEFLFHTAKDVLSKMYALPLVKKRVEELRVKWEALFFLHLEEEALAPESAAWPGQGKLDFLRLVEQRTSELKQQLTAAPNVPALLKTGQEIIHFLDGYNERFGLVFDSSFPIAEEQVLSKEILDTAVLIRFLKQGVWPDEATRLVSREKKRLLLFS